MKTLTLVFIFVFFSLSVITAQNYYHVNPEGDTVWFGKMPDITSEIEAELNAIPSLDISTQSENTVLPDKHDNYPEIWMRDVFNQQSNSCSQAAGIGYTFTYEINRLRNIPSNHDDRTYPPDFTYNFLNYGAADSGSLPTHGFIIVEENGCPNVTTYGDMWMPPTKWMHGYDKYYSGLYNHINEKHTLKPSDDIDFEKFKHWLYDHGSGDPSGGLAVFIVDEVRYPMKSEDIVDGEESDAQIITDWISDELEHEIVGHTMTIVGYNDNIKYDFNSDGQYSDWEYGAVKVANSWGTGWMDEGYVYVAYHMLKALNSSISKYVYMIDADNSYQPEIVLKVKVDHNYRNRLKFYTAYGENADVSIPDPQKRKFYFAFDKRGGPNPMQGKNNWDPIEIALDFNGMYSDIENFSFGKVFFEVFQSDDDDGTINNFSLIDYRWDEILEVPCEQSEIDTQEGFTTLDINYDVLPFVISALDLGTNVLDISTDKVVRKQTVVRPGMTVNIESGTQIDFYNSELIIEDGATLNVGQFVEFVDKTGNSKLTINGEVNFTSHTNFISEGEDKFVIKFRNQSDEIIQNLLSYENCEIHSFAASLDVTNSDFEDCGMVNSYLGDVDLDNCQFVNSGLYLENGGLETDAVSVTDCNFSTNTSLVGISLWNYRSFSISTNNTFSGYYDGIQVMQTGQGAPASRTISGNTISGSTNAGIVTFNSGVNITENIIQNNNDGIRVLNNSTVNIYGNPAATDYSEVNQIRNNDRYELYASTGSFPWYFSYNSIKDADNTGNPVDPHIYYQPSGTSETLDVRYNCWDNSFNATQDLYPSGSFNYLPTWCPTEGSNKSSDIVLQSFLEGLEDFENGEYNDSKETFEEVIEQYPQTPYAAAAMKELFALEPFADNDFVALQQYYDTNDSIQGDSALAKLSTFLANKCDIAQQNWQTAIDHFEDIIENPDTPEDSIFAIIDLGYTYFLMENSSKKSTAQGSMLQHKPDNMQYFSATRDSLLAMLPFQKSTENNTTELNKSEPGELLQNVPNPFTGHTVIYFALEKQAKIELKVYDHLGKIIKQISRTNTQKGTNKIEIEMSDVPPGLYMYSLFINGELTDTKKMVVR